MEVVAVRRWLTVDDPARSAARCLSSVVGRARVRVIDLAPVRGRGGQRTRRRHELPHSVRGVRFAPQLRGFSCRKLVAFAILRRYTCQAIPASRRSRTQLPSKRRLATQGRCASAPPAVSFCEWRRLTPRCNRRSPWLVSDSSRCRRSAPAVERLVVGSPRWSSQ